MKAEEGDSGGPVYARSGKGVEIAGVLTAKGDFYSPLFAGNLMNGSPEIKAIAEASVVCTDVKNMEKEWPVPITGEWIPPGTTVKKCVEEAGDIATITMSANAEKTDTDIKFTIGYEHLSAYEPMSQVEALYKGQGLLVAKK